MAFKEPRGVFRAAPCPSCICLFWQGAKSLASARVEKEERGEGAWGRNSFHPDQEIDSAQSIQAGPVMEMFGKSSRGAPRGVPRSLMDVGAI